MTAIFTSPQVRTFFGIGNSAMHGSTLVAGTPDAPVSRRVQLWSGILLAPRLIVTQYSDAEGLYTFTRLGRSLTSDGYTVIAYDHTGVHDPVAKTNLVPSPMPPDPTEHV